MLKLIGWTIQAAFFTLAVLVLGNWVRFDGRTVSEHVRLKMVAIGSVFHSDHHEALATAKKIPEKIPEKISQKVKRITDRVSFGSAAPHEKGREASQKDREELRNLIKKF